MIVDVHKSNKRGNVFTLKQPLLVRWHGRTIRVPPGFESDGCSVPRFFWRLVFPPSDTNALRAGLAHDYIYRHHPDGWTKCDADLMFFNLLVADGVPKWRAWLAYLGVKYFGFWAWNANKKE